MPQRLINARPSKDAIYGGTVSGGGGGTEPIPVEGTIGAVDFSDDALHDLATVTAPAGPEATSDIFLSVPYSVTTGELGGAITFTIQVNGVTVDQVTVDQPGGLTGFRDIFNRSLLAHVPAGSSVYLSQIQGNSGIVAT